MIWLQITITAKYQRINTQLMKIITNKYTRRLTYTLKRLIKLKNTKKLTWRSTKQTWTFLKNWTALLWRSTKKMNITEKLSSTFTTKHKTEYNYTLVEQHFYDVIQNRIQLHFGEPKKGVTNLKTQDQKG